MSPLVKNVLIFFAGVVCGGVPSALYFKKKYEKKADEEILAEYNRLEGKKSVPKRYISNREVPKKEEIPETAVKPRSSLDGQRVRRRRIDYTTYYPDPAEAESPQDDQVVDGKETTGRVMTEEAIKNKGKGAKLIPEADYGQDPTYDPIELLYWQFDDIITSADEEEYEDLDEVADMLGNTLDKYDFRNSDESCIYVRNYDRKVDYMITKVRSSFREGG